MISVSCRTGASCCQLKWAERTWALSTTRFAFTNINRLHLLINRFLKISIWKKILQLISDPDSYWIRILWPFGSGSVLLYVSGSAQCLQFFFNESPDVKHVFYHLDLDPVCNIRQDLDPDPYIIIIWSIGSETPSRFGHVSWSQTLKQVYFTPNCRLTPLSGKWILTGCCSGREPRGPTGPLPSTPPPSIKCCPACSASIPPSPGWTAYPGWLET